MTATRPEYQPPRLKDDRTTRQRRRVAWMIALILVIVAGVTYFAFDERTVSLISTAIALIPTIIALMPQTPELEYSASAGERPADENRERMLYNVYQTWIQGALYPNLPAGAIDLSLELQPHAVVRRVNYDDYQLPDISNAIDRVFDDMRGQLLILGEPGSGKTILLLRLAERLLGRAQHNPKHPIPAVFNLSSWGRQQKPLAEWLVDELRSSYGVPRKTGEAWVKNGRLTLLLDGLDELAPAADMMPGADQATLEEKAIELRSACIDAINDYHRANSHVDLVVCSRIRDYEALTTRLDLNAAVLLRELTDEQISTYLAGKEHAGTRDLLRRKPTAAQMAKAPFLLTMMKMVYAGRPYTGSPFRQLRLEDEGERQDHLLSEYVNIQLSEHQHARYDRNETLHYLRWLAWQMLRNKESVFYIENLQPDWTVHQKRYRLIVVLLLGSSIGSLFGLSFGLASGSSAGLPAILGGLGYGLLFGLLNIEFAESFSWRNGFSRELLLGVLLFVLISGFTLLMLFGVLYIWLIFSHSLIVGGLLFSLRLGLTVESSLDVKNKPNAGFMLSIRNGLVAGVLFGLCGTLGLGLSLSLSSSLFLGLLLVLLLGLLGGWRPVVQHIVLRIFLSTEGVIPRWRYDRFLNYCAEAGLLRKVGGGYIFRHRLLLEHFASQYKP